ncbi:MAG: hypothetical protein HUU28_18720, partial [Planctomycetaceae bacterium]|nr:hypothetical protein [Planctomycetaceae bacterium]
MDFTLLGAYPMLMLEGWPQTSDPAALARTYADPGFRRRARDDLARSRPTRLFNGHWDRVEVTIAAKPEIRALEGRTIAEIAAARGADPFDAFLDIGLADGLETTFTAKLLNAEEDEVGALLAVDGNLVSLSDAGAHHTFFCDAGFGMYFLGHWVREKKRFTLPRAIKKLSSDLADIYGLPDRGPRRFGLGSLGGFDEGHRDVARAHGGVKNRRARPRGQGRGRSGSAPEAILRRKAAGGAPGRGLQRFLRSTSSKNGSSSTR